MISIHHSLYPGAEKNSISGLTSYNHEVLSVGGYRNANIVFNSNNIVAEDWFYNGVGRHIEVHSRLGNIVWEGLVNEVSFSVGDRKTKVKSLLDISNNIRIGWQYPNYNVVGDPLSGKYDETDWEINKISQVRYGVLDEFISGGSASYNEIIAMQIRLLESLSEPIISESISTGGSSPVSISLSCIGYARILEKQVYNQEWLGASLVDISEKFNTMLDENQFFVKSRFMIRDIQHLGVDVPPEDEKNRTVWGIMTDHIGKSLIADDVVMGMFSNLSFVLAMASSSRSYKRKAGSSIIYDASGNIKIENSEVLPGGTMVMVDFSRPIQYRINSIKYDLRNNSVSINFHDESLRVLLSEMMLGGMFS